MNLEQSIDPQIARRGADVREIFADEQPTRRLVPVCAWCPDAFEQTAAARAHGHDVTHGMCAVHQAAFNAQVDALEARRA